MKRTDSIQRRALAVGSLLLACCLPGSAAAGSFTLAAPVVIDGSEMGNPGVLGRIDPVVLGVGILSDALGATNRNVVLNPSRFAGQDVFIFDLTLNAGSLNVDQIGVTVGVTNFMGNPVGAGYYADAGDVAPTGDFTSLGLGAGTIANFGLNVNQSILAFPLCSQPSNALTCTGQGAGLFQFNTPLAAGQTTVRLFVTHEPAGTADLLQTVSFMISSGTDFTVQGAIVPEPSTVALLGGGLLILLATARRGRRH